MVSVEHYVKRLAHRLVPGNHDICFNRPFDEDPTLAGRARRERAFQAHGPRLADYVVGLPSSTLGDKSVGGVLDGMMRYAVAGLRADGGWGLALVPVAPVVAPTLGVVRGAPRVVPAPALRALSPIL